MGQLAPAGEVPTAGSDGKAETEGTRAFLACCDGAGWEPPPQIVISDLVIEGIDGNIRAHPAKLRLLN